MCYSHKSTLTALQLLVDDDDQLPFGLAAWGSGTGRAAAAAAAQELLAHAYGGARHGHRHLAQLGLLPVQQRRSLLSGPGGRRRRGQHVDSREDWEEKKKKKTTAGVPKGTEEVQSELA